MATAPSPESALRDKLKVALQDAKRLYEEDLIDADELKDLKSHELRKYKAQLDALAVATTASSTATATASPAVPRMPMPAPPAAAAAPGMHLRTPPVSRRLAPSLALSPAAAAAGVRGCASAPPAKRRRQETLVVEPEIYHRLMTPPLFRRRTPAKRRIVLKTDDLAALKQEGCDPAAS